MDMTVCPECGSDKITELTTYQIVVERNVKTGKVLRKSKSPEKNYPVMWSFCCRKCEWKSETFTD